MRAVLLAALALSACTGTASYRMAETEFRPTDDRKGFAYKALAAADVGGFDSPSGEATRLDILREWLRLNSMCPAGFDIASRNPVVDAQGLLGTRGYVHYQGRCKA